MQGAFFEEFDKRYGKFVSFNEFCRKVKILKYLRKK